ncbi:MAG: hypothetical protein JKY88_18715 [Pseudomonadales bacterium]|nr:hypothetical protein [Pseudomonadales bacterium]
MVVRVEFTLSFNGAESDDHHIDLYDISQALIGFQRSLALTTHLVLNNKIITQSPALKGAKVFAVPAEEGSWNIKGVVIASVISGGAYQLTTTPNNTPLGHLIFSAYDYLVKESLGFHVDYNKSLGKLYEEQIAEKADVPKIEQHKMDSLIEKCSTAISEIHRPLYKTKSAINAKIIGNYGQGASVVGGELNLSTYEYVHESFREEQPVLIAGRVSSYNSNTFKGRIYVAGEGRPITFELSSGCRSSNSIQLIVNSLTAYATRENNSEWSTIHCKAQIPR